jgi:hypothetical protein
LIPSHFAYAGTDRQLAIEFDPGLCTDDNTKAAEAAF